MRAARRLIGAAMLMAAAAAPAMSQTVDIPTARQLAIGMTQHDQPLAALALANALLERDPSDVVALIARARALRSLGDYRAALSAARAAWALADTGVERHYAALALAQVLASDNKRLMAQVWLRRAIDLAPNAATRAQAIRDYAYVRARTPLSITLSAGATPSSNVNGGPTTPFLTLGGITFTDPTAQPISGIELSFGARLGYRLKETPTARHTLGLQFDDTRVILGPEAASIAPALDAADLAQQSAETGWTGEWELGPGRHEIDAGLSLGHIRSGGADIANTARASLGYSFPLGTGGRMRLGLAAQHDDRLDAALRSADTISLSASWRGSIGDDQVSLGLTLSDVDSASAAIARQSATLAFDYARAEPVLGAALGFGLSLGATDYDHGLFGPDPRQDRRVRANVSARITQVEWMGFNPVIDLMADRNFSTVGPYDTQTVGLSLRLQSSF